MRSSASRGRSAATRKGRDALHAMKLLALVFEPTPTASDLSAFMNAFGCKDYWMMDEVDSPCSELIQLVVADGIRSSRASSELLVVLASVPVHPQLDSLHVIAGLQELGLCAIYNFAHRAFRDLADRVLPVLDNMDRLQLVSDEGYDITRILVEDSPLEIYTSLARSFEQMDSHIIIMTETMRRMLLDRMADVLSEFEVSD